MSEADAIPIKTNLAIAMFIVIAVLTELFVFPVWLRGHPYVMAALVLLMVPLNTPFWSLIHEGIHNNFLPGAKRNLMATRALSVLFGGSFHLLRFGHLMHHRFNRDWESEIYGLGQNRFVAAANHYFKMLGGLYGAEVGGSFLLAMAPKSLAEKICRNIFSDDRQYNAALSMMLKDKNLREARIDCALIVLLYGLSFYIYGVNWPVLLLMIYGRALAISILDNAYHYGTPPDNSIEAKELQAPPFYARFILNFNHHRTHHKNVGLPWKHLPRRREELGVAYNEPIAAAVLAQFKGPIRS